MMPAMTHEKTTPTLTRRDAIGLTVTACACCCLGAEESDKPDKDTPPTPKQFSIGKLTDYPNPGFYDAHRKNKVMVCVVADQLVVMSAVCTHKNCLVRKHEEKVLRCSCHKSFFSDHGTPTEGPAKIALPRYAVKLEEDGTITVDTTKSFAEREWEKPEAFIAIKK